MPTERPIDDTPEWAYGDSGSCGGCGSEVGRLHTPYCWIRDALDGLAAVESRDDE